MSVDKKMKKERLRADIRIYTIFDIYNMIKQHKLDLHPYYIRNFRWPEENKRQLIYSIMQGFPVTGIYVQEDRQGHFQLIDGLQRLSTIVDFLDDKFPVDEDNRKVYFSDLSVVEQRRIQDYQLVIYIIRAEEELAAKLSSMMNASTLSLLPQEKRNYIYRNQGIPFVKRLAEKNEFKQIISGKDISLAKMQDEELILRFLSFYYKGFECYAGNMTKFLDDTLQNYELYIDREYDTEKFFSFACQLIYEIWGNNAFVVKTDSRKRMNIALYDIILYSFAIYGNERLIQNKERIRKLLDDLLNNDDRFRMAVLGNSNTSREKVHARFEIWMHQMKKICC